MRAAKPERSHHRVDTNRCTGRNANRWAADLNDGPLVPAGQGVVGDGRDAWDQIAKGFDAVVTDYAMSDSLGTPVCQGLRQHRKYGSIPMIVVAIALAGLVLAFPRREAAFDWITNQMELKA